ncbi:hypothetical protein CRM22_005661 [Opisthorchis felineus]|uniref:EGF-like domain-containing protein n=1 Tax=Opisthorchis felineus TaxID=147828 RepID=A0A4S2LRF9_OPIFE|nr:hypothetical protein CRM22_005661 [Opisthorchis felineus]
MYRQRCPPHTSLPVILMYQIRFKTLCFFWLAFGSVATAMNRSFCTDLSPIVFSVEQMELTNPMFGSEYNTMETLFSLEFEEVFEPVYSEPCLIKCNENESCTIRVREMFRKQLLTLGRGSSRFESELLLEHGDFITYVNREKSRWSMSTQSFFVTGCLGICGMLWRKQMHDIYSCLCPNPCHHQQHCLVKACTQVGIFEHEYTCECPSGQKWDSDIHVCLSGNYIELRDDQKKHKADECDEKTKCHPAGTLYCHHDSIAMEGRCVCRPQYFGVQCERPVNACEQLVKHPDLPNGGLRIPGHIACNVIYAGNRCRSYTSGEGDIYYRCSCNGHPWIPDPGLAYDNCLKKRTVCDSAVCVHGDCRTSEYGGEAYCLCYPGFSGSACSLWVGEWSEWLPWDTCRPGCGDVRYTVRTRNCLSLMKNLTDQRECLGASVEYAKCGEHPCARTGSYIETYFAIRQDAIAATVATAAITCAAISLTWLFFFSSMVSRVIHGLLARFQQKRDPKRYYGGNYLPARF